MSKQINLDNYENKESKIKAISNYIIARERNAFSSRGLEDPYITDKQFQKKFTITGGLPVILELAEEFYTKRYARRLESKIIKRFEEEIEKQSNSDIITGIRMCIRIIIMNKEFLNF